MKKIWNSLAKFQALSLRERLMALFAALVVLYFVFDLALLGPQRTQAKLLHQKVTQQNVEIAALKKAMGELSLNPQAESLAAQRAERDALQMKIEGARSLFGDAAAEVQMGEVIRSMVGATPGLTLVAIKTLPVQPFFKSNMGPVVSAPAAAKPASAVAASAVPALTLYKHGVEVVVKGNYLALIPYLQNLERSPNRMFWGDANLETNIYPEATLRMVVNTLSARPDSPLN